MVDIEITPYVNRQPDMSREIWFDWHTDMTSSTRAQSEIATIVESETTNVAIEPMMIGGTETEIDIEIGIAIGSVTLNVNAVVVVGDPAHQADIITTLEAHRAVTMS